MIARRQQGMALIESIVAAVLLAVGQGAHRPRLHADDAEQADRLLGMMAVDLPNAGAYALAAGATPNARLQPWYDDTRARIPNAQVVIAVTPAAGRTRVAITISWTRKTGAAQNAHRVVSYLAAAT
ncbi:hypothetical protein ACEN88_22660 [Massilia sp. CT11-108]|uniref:hypothetical protein n=1 Tax=Massilia sp. CT11-108 TaxID=3393900 RepID=UPI0039A55D90